jgi:hypothetical protein
MATIIDTPTFRQSPMLVRLLRFLVDETLAGRGDRLKAYSVAVEGLGRSEDFDVRLDSYPRVQVGRLRKALESHYATYAPVGDTCLHLQPGSYKVRMAAPASAYPHLYRPLAQPASNGAAALAEHREPPSPRPHRGRLPWTTRPVHLLVSIVLVAGLALIGFIAVQRLNNGRLGIGAPGPAELPSGRIMSPVVWITPVDTDRDVQAERLGRAVYANLVDGMERSWITRVRTSRSGTGDERSMAAGAAYQIDSQLVHNSDGSWALFVRLSDARASTLIWSATSQIVERDGSVRVALAPIVAQLGSAYGEVAKDQMMRLHDRYDPGYACLLQYVAYGQVRDQSRLPRIRQCLEAQGGESDLAPKLVATRALLIMDTANDAPSYGSATETALNLATQAVSLNPKDGYAQFALARIHYATGNCAAGEEHGRLVVAANPYAPAVLATLGGFMYRCGDREGLAWIDRAFEVQTEGLQAARLALLIVAIAEPDERDRRDALRKIGSVLAYGRGLKRGHQPYDLLCATLANALAGHTAAARISWQNFVAASRRPGLSADSLLRTYIWSDTFRGRVLDFLRARQILADIPRAPSAAGAQPAQAPADQSVRN